MSSGPGGPSFPIVLAAPSGTGKTTVARRLVSTHADFVFSVSATTRPPRRRERHGVDYEFVSREAFEAMVVAGALAEWAEVHGNLYGTPKAALATAAEGRKWPVLDIDVQGAIQVRGSCPEAVLIFLLPPTARELWRRLTRRGTEGRIELGKRLRAARAELREAGGFDYVLVNDDVDRAVDAIRRIAGSVVRGGSRRRSRGDETWRLLGEIDELLALEGMDP